MTDGLFLVWCQCFSNGFKIFSSWDKGIGKVTVNKSQIEIHHQRRSLAIGALASYEIGFCQMEPLLNGLCRLGQEIVGIFYG